jgi:hypothetical protein
MNHATFCRRQAEALINLSQSTFDLVIAARLRALAAEFRARADQIEDEAQQFSPFALSQNPLSAGRAGCK